MQNALIVLLAIACLALLVRVYTVEHSLRGVVRQLRAAGQTQSAVRLLMRTPNGAAEALVAEMNALLELRRSDEAAYRARESTLRQQISNISHDLRTPLTSILGYLQLLEAPDLVPAERQEYLGVVKSRAKALQGLISGFYDLSRLEGDEFPLERKKMDLGQTVRSLLAAFYGDFTDAGFDVQVEIPEDLPAVTADEGAVLRVFTNLLRNALDHGERRMEVRLYAAGGRVISEIRNSVPEVHPEALPHVFDRFFTSDTMRTGRNTGLGLAIVKALADRMGASTEAGLESGMFLIRIEWS